MVVVVCALVFASCEALVPPFDPLAGPPDGALSAPRGWAAPATPEEAAEEVWLSAVPPPEVLRHRAPPLSRERFRAQSGGFTAWNEVQNIGFELSTTGFVVVGEDGGSLWRGAVDSFGRAGAPWRLGRSDPGLVRCPIGFGCDRRVEWALPGARLWALNTVHGLTIGFEIGSIAPGTGPLRVDLSMAGAPVVRARDGGGSLEVIAEYGESLSWGALRVMDASGRLLPASFTVGARGPGVVIDDSQARYPIVVEADVGRCPSTRCSDGDWSTVDVCTAPGHFAPTCERVLDDRYRDEPCVWGVFCCPDGVYRDDCLLPLEAPPGGGTPATSPDRGSTASDEPAPDIGTPCPDVWCTDGDPTTLDICTTDVVRVGGFSCAHPYDGTQDGEHCWWGKFCCDNTISGDCEQGTGV